MVSINKRMRGSLSYGSSGEEGDHDNEAIADASGGVGNGNNDQDPLVTNSMSLTLETSYCFKNVNTVSYGIFMLCASIGLFLACALIPEECLEKECFIKPISLLFYLHSIYWGLILICDQLIQLEHIKARRRGYLDFYNSNNFISQLPFWIVSTWSSLLLTISTILRDHCPKEEPCGKTIKLNKEEYIIILIGFEFVFVVSVILRYIYKVWHFNRKRNLPDVLAVDNMFNNAALDFGPRSLGPVTEEVFERQADLINYYREHNSMLKQKLLELNSQILASSNSREPVPL